MTKPSPAPQEACAALFNLSSFPDLPSAGSHKATNDAVYRIALEILEKESQVLDLGCGQEHMTRRLARWFAQQGVAPSDRITAADIEPRFFEAREVSCRRADANERLPFDDQTFDLIVTIEMLEHVQNVYAVFQECARILKPGGTIIFSVPNIAHFASRWKFLTTGFYTLYHPPSVDPNNAHRICGHITPLTYAYHSYGLRRAAFENIRFVKDRTKRWAAAFTVAVYWLLRPAAALYRRDIAKYDAKVAAENDEVMRTMSSWDMLTSRSCIVIARRSHA